MLRNGFLLFLFFFFLCFSFISTPVSSASVVDKLIGLWKMDFNSQDATTNNRDLVLVPNLPAKTTWIAGRFYKAISISDVFFQLPNAMPIITNVVSVSMWIKPAFGNRTTGGVLASTKFIWNASTGFEISYNPSKKAFSALGSGAKLATWSVGTLNPLGWHHVVFVFNGSTVTFYLNNKNQGQKAIDPAKSSANVLSIGRRTQSQPLSSYYGGLDDIRLYYKALDAATVQLLFNNPYAVSPSPSRSRSRSRSRAVSHSRSPSRGSVKTPSRTKSRTRSKSRTPSKVAASRSKAPTSGIDFGLVGLWRFEGNGWDTSYYKTGGSVTFTKVTYGTGKWGQAAVFDGTGYGTIPATTGALHNLHTGFSISVWYYPEFPVANKIDSRLVSKKEGWDSTSGWEFNYNQGVQFFDMLGSGSTMAGWTVDLKNNQWYHIVLLVSGTQVTFYLNNQNQGAQAIDPIVINQLPVTLGRIAGNGWTEGTFLFGKLEDLRIYNRILTATDMNQLYNNNPYPSPQVTPTRSPSKGTKVSATPFPSPKPFTVPAEMDPRFIDKIQATGMDNPLGVLITPDGRMIIWQKSGKAYWYKSDGTKSIFVDFGNLKIGDVGDHGLLSMALHPKYSTNRWVYVYYTVHPGDGLNNMDVWVYSRVARYKVGANDQVDMSTEQILIGPNQATGIPACSSTHTAGTILFGNDGMLYISHGDGARFEFVDWGDDLQCGQKFGQDQNIGAFRSQSLDTMSGKILRVDPETGKGLTDNPFYTVGLSLDSPRSRVWALGLRNPFRMDIRPVSPYDPAGASVFYLTDVGWNTWEELNVVKRGYNMGWPCYEGPDLNTQYSDNAHCKNLKGTLSPPFLAWHHFDNTLSKPPGFQGQAGTGVTFYKGTRYPNAFQWKNNGGVFTFFWCDYAQNWVKAGFVDAHDKFLGFTDFFSTPAPVYMGSSPNSFNYDIFYVTIAEGAVHSITYPDSVLPVVRIAVDRTSLGLAPATVQFWSDGSYDPYGRHLSFLWRFGDGKTSTLANPQHTFTTMGKFNVSLTITTPDGSHTEYLGVNTMQASPAVKITAPLNGHIYTLGDKIKFTATRSAETTLFWDLQLMHMSHFHPQTDYSTEVSPTFEMAADTELDTGERYCWRTVVTATDAQGNTASDQVMLYGTRTTTNNPATIVFFPPANAQAGKAIYFDATGSFDEDGDLLELSWNFGDGTTVRETKSIADTRHVYDNPGVYTITLSVWETFGLISKVTNTITVHESSLVGLWQMNENGGTVAYDTSGTGINGDIINGAGRVAGINGNAIDLDGTTQSILVKGGTTDLNKLTDYVTISVWLFPTTPNTVNNWIRIVSKKTFWDSPNGFEVQYNPATPAISFVGSGKTVAYGWTDLPLNAWTHLAFVATKGTITMYKNAVVVGTGAIDPVVGNLLNLNIGKFAGDNSAFFAGRLDNLRIYSAALTAAQVQQLFDNKM